MPWDDLESEIAELFDAAQPDVDMALEERRSWVKAQKRSRLRLDFNPRSFETLRPAPPARKRRRVFSLDDYRNARGRQRQTERDTTRAVILRLRALAPKPNWPPPKPRGFVPQWPREACRPKRKPSGWPRGVRRNPDNLTIDRTRPDSTEVSTKWRDRSLRLSKKYGHR